MEEDQGSKCKKLNCFEIDESSKLKDTDKYWITGF